MRFAVDSKVDEFLESLLSILFMRFLQEKGYNVIDIGNKEVSFQFSL